MRDTYRKDCDEILQNLKIMSVFFRVCCMKNRSTNLLQTDGNTEYKLLISVE